MNKTSQFGRSMIEILAVLSIMGILSASIISAVSSLMNQYRHSVIGTQLRDLRKNINNRYAADGRYTGLTAKILIDERLVPHSMLNGQLIRNAFGGSVTVAPADTGGANRSYTITFNRLPRRTCVEMATLDWKVDSSATLVSITVNNTKFSWPYNKLGSGGVGHETLANPLPITGARAMQSCSTELDNIITWEFH